MAQPIVMETQPSTSAVAPSSGTGLELVVYSVQKGVTELPQKPIITDLDQKIAPVLPESKKIVLATNAAASTSTEIMSDADLVRATTLVETEATKLPAGDANRVTLERIAARLRGSASGTQSSLQRVYEALRELLFTPPTPVVGITPASARDFLNRKAPNLFVHQPTWGQYLRSPGTSMLIEMGRQMALLLDTMNFATLALGTAARQNGILDYMPLDVTTNAYATTLIKGGFKTAVDNAPPRISDILGNFAITTNALYSTLEATSVSDSFMEEEAQLGFITNLTTFAETLARTAGIQVDDETLTLFAPALAELGRVAAPGVQRAEKDFRAIQELETSLRGMKFAIVPADSAKTIQIIETRKAELQSSIDNKLFGVYRRLMEVIAKMVTLVKGGQKALKTLQSETNDLRRAAGQSALQLEAQAMEVPKPEPTPPKPHTLVAAAGQLSSTSGDVVQIMHLQRTAIQSLVAAAGASSKLTSTTNQQLLASMKDLRESERFARTEVTKLQGVIARSLPDEERVSALRRSLDECKAENARLRSELEASRKSTADAQSARINDEKRFTTRLASSEGRIDKLAKDLDDCKDDKAKLRAQTHQLVGAEGQVVRLREELKGQRTEAAQSTTSMREAQTRLQKELDRLSLERTKWLKEETSLRGLLREARTESAVLQRGELPQLQITLREKELEIDRLKGDAIRGEAAVKKLEAAETSIEDLTGKLRGLTVVQDLRATVERAAANLINRLKAGNAENFANSLPKLVLGAEKTSPLNPEWISAVANLAASSTLKLIALAKKLVLQREVKPMKFGGEVEELLDAELSPEDMIAQLDQMATRSAEEIESEQRQTINFRLLIRNKAAKLGVHVDDVKFTARDFLDDVISIVNSISFELEDAGIIPVRSDIPQFIPAMRTSGIASTSASEQFFPRKRLGMIKEQAVGIVQFTVTDLHGLLLPKEGQLDEGLRGIYARFYRSPSDSFARAAVARTLRSAIASMNQFYLIFGPQGDELDRILTEKQKMAVSSSGDLQAFLGDLPDALRRLMKYVWYSGTIFSRMAASIEEEITATMSNEVSSVLLGVEPDKFLSRIMSGGVPIQTYEAALDMVAATFAGWRPSAFTQDLHKLFDSLVTLTTAPDTPSVHVELAVQARTFAVENQMDRLVTWIVTNHPDTEMIPELDLQALQNKIRTLQTELEITQRSASDRSSDLLRALSKVEEERGTTDELRDRLALEREANQAHLTQLVQAIPGGPKAVAEATERRQRVRILVNPVQDVGVTSVQLHRPDTTRLTARQSEDIARILREMSETPAGAFSSGAAQTNSRMLAVLEFGSSPSSTIPRLLNVPIRAVKHPDLYEFKDLPGQKLRELWKAADHSHLSAREVGVTDILYFGASRGANEVWKGITGAGALDPQSIVQPDATIAITSPGNLFLRMRQSVTSGAQASSSIELGGREWWRLPFDLKMNPPPRGGVRMEFTYRVDVSTTYPALGDSRSAVGTFYAVVKGRGESRCFELQRWLFMYTFLQ